MYKLKYILFGLLLAFSCDLFAQKIAIYNGGLTLNMRPGAIRDSAVIDTTQLSIKYRFSCLSQVADPVVRCNILLQIGSRVVKQQDLVMYYAQMLNADRWVNESVSDKLDAEGNSVSNLFSEIYCDRQTGMMTILCGDFFDRDKMKDYQQQLPLLIWELGHQTQQVCGYSCHAAVAMYGGREWRVWYTTEIPYAYGPWMLNGLPGTILYATDGDNFTFECIEITQCATPISHYRYQPVQHLKDLATYLRYERNCYEHPYEVFAQGGAALLYMSGADGKLQAVDASYTIPYVPIEHEQKDNR